MCGIVGYIGKKNAAEVIIKGLKRLEYRGYDSAGIATLESNNFEVTKTAGKVIELQNSIKKNTHNGKVGIGHTRWATHGPPNMINSHPHFDNNQKFTLVHNGIIENYNSIKKHLEDNDIFCKTDTDSEVLVQFIAYLYDIIIANQSLN